MTWKLGEKMKIDSDCPNCGNRALRERAKSSLENIRRREIKSKHARIVCDHCRTTFNSELVEVKPPSADVDENGGTDW